MQSLRFSGRKNSVIHEPETKVIKVPLNDKTELNNHEFEMIWKKKNKLTKMTEVIEERKSHPTTYNECVD